MRQILIGFLVLTLFIPMASYAREKEKDADRGDKIEKSSETITTRWTPLMLASISGDLKAIKAALAKGEDINGTNQTGDTPLMYAALAGEPNIVQFLLSKGANVNAKENLGITALMAAAMKGKDRKSVV